VHDRTEPSGLENARNFAGNLYFFGTCCGSFWPVISERNWIQTECDALDKDHRNSYGMGVFTVVKLAAGKMENSERSKP